MFNRSGINKFEFQEVNGNDKILVYLKIHITNIIFWFNKKVK